jgi:hypothetical protein
MWWERTEQKSRRKWTNLKFPQWLKLIKSSWAASHVSFRGQSRSDVMLHPGRKLVKTVVIPGDIKSLRNSRAEHESRGKNVRGRSLRLLEDINYDLLELNRWIDEIGICRKGHEFLVSLTAKDYTRALKWILKGFDNGVFFSITLIIPFRAHAFYSVP